MLQTSDLTFRPGKVHLQHPMKGSDHYLFQKSENQSIPAVFEKPYSSGCQKFSQICRQQMEYHNYMKIQPVQYIFLRDEVLTILLLPVPLNTLNYQQTPGTGSAPFATVHKMYSFPYNQHGTVKHW